MSRRSNLVPTSVLRYKEDIIFYISISIVLKAVALSNKLLIAFFKST